MTIITKAIGDKKGKNGDKLDQPLVVDGVEIPVNGADGDAEAQRPNNDYVVRQRYLILAHNALQPSAITTLCLFMTAVIVVAIGIAGGVSIYRLYARDQMHRFRTGWYNIPYDSSNKPLMSQPFSEYLADLPPQGLFSDSDLFKSFSKQKDNTMMSLEKLVERTENYFRERFEIDLDNENYEKIDVPDFRNGRRGRFIHDFNMNKTGIVDVDGRSCFVMPLNRKRVLPPRNMYDLLKKMYNGYYEVDTEIVRETMKVITPPITDLSTVGAYIARECVNMTTYLLQPVRDNVFKRSTSDGVFGVFAGNSIMEVDIINLSDIVSQNKK